MLNLPLKLVINIERRATSINMKKYESYKKYEVKYGINHKYQNQNQHNFLCI